MTEFGALVRRNCKLFFQDKGMFFTSLITPVILLVLYATFLAKIYKDSFGSALPTGVAVEEALIDGMVGGQLVSSLLAVCCVTVAFCSNLLMVQDKITGACQDLAMSPVKKSTIAWSYFVASTCTTLLICLAALGICMGYLYLTGWYLSLSDVLWMCLDVVLLVLFGTILSSVINCNLSTSGQSSAVGTIVSAGYGFVCGAYMPISNFSDGLQKVLSFFPGTYGTALVRNHALNGVFAEMEELHVPAEVIAQIKDSVDCNLYFMGNQVGMSAMYAVMAGTILVLGGIYVGIHKMK